MGNILELCAFELYPDPKISLGFTMCITRDYDNIPGRELVEDCALEHAIDVGALNDCAMRDTGAHGLDMLRRSVMRSSDVSRHPSLPSIIPMPLLGKHVDLLTLYYQAGVTKSCTVRLNEDIYCVRDYGEWSPCPGTPSVEKLVSSIEDSYRSL